MGQMADIGPRSLLLQWDPQIGEFTVLTSLGLVWRTSNVGHSLLVRDIWEARVQN